ncbi:hypothetical protein P154DRAFT_158357 [Amniculicola lignicola CBS 123094]|uniref:Uncharacterized protein n=1 Tax=Amniculicola lignicola CBS 123094 TaxID=1392246 RepID=A0A6A5WJ56_9PLEO|nr:hypothetical protein P154DRAFT_158357 [Amniculicola lignicola CBS 123094]
MRRDEASSWCCLRTGCPRRTTGLEGPPAATARNASIRLHRLSHSTLRIAQAAETDDAAHACPLQALAGLCRSPERLETLRQSRRPPHTSAVWGPAGQTAMIGARPHTCRRSRSPTKVCPRRCDLCARSNGRMLDAAFTRRTGRDQQQRDLPPKMKHDAGEWPARRARRASPPVRQSLRSEQDMRPVPKTQMWDDGLSRGRAPFTGRTRSLAGPVHWQDPFTGGVLRPLVVSFRRPSSSTPRGFALLARCGCIARQPDCSTRCGPPPEESRSPVSG